MLIFVLILLKVPFYFDCFGPITDFSIFRVNVSLYPQLCRNSYPILFAGIQHQSE